MILKSALLLILSVVTAAGEPATAPATTQPAVDGRPRLAVVGFESDANGDPRDAWIPVALEELLARRLQRVPTLLALPTVRLYQARAELADPNTTPPWRDVVRGLGAQYLVSGFCRGNGQRCHRRADLPARG